VIYIAERFDVIVDVTGAAKVELAATENPQNSAAIFDFEPRRPGMMSRRNNIYTGLPLAAIFDFEPRRPGMMSRRNNVYTGLPLAATQERRIDCPTKVLTTSCRALLILQTGK